jgi:hypothetical protein
MCRYTVQLKMCGIGKTILQQTQISAAIKKLMYHQNKVIICQNMSKKDNKTPIFKVKSFFAIFLLVKPCGEYHLK